MPTVFCIDQAHQTLRLVVSDVNAAVDVEGRVVWVPWGEFLVM